MYKKRNAICKKLREAKDRKRLESELVDYPLELPKLRRQIIVRDFDFGEVEHVFNLYKSNRVDCYKVEVDGKILPRLHGWSKCLELIRKGSTRVLSPNSC